MDSRSKFIAADAGKGFQSLIHIDRLPYTWGEVKSGKLGIDYNDREIRRSEYFNRKEKQFIAPVLIPFFDDLRRSQAKKIELSETQADLYHQKFNKIAAVIQEEKTEETKVIENFELKFPVQ